MTIRSILLSGILLLLGSLAEARPGKVFFPNGRWLKGDIVVQTNDDGKEVVVIALNSGSLTFSRSEIKRILYESNDSPHQKRFLKALENTHTRPYAARANSIYDTYIRIASEKHELDPELVRAVIKQESNFNQYDVSRKGAQGLMQLMPDTAKRLGVNDSFDPWQNIHGGTRYLRTMLEQFNGDLSKALAAYNAGPGAVRKYGTIPPYRETQGYVRNVLKYYRNYRGTQLFSFNDKNGQLVITDQPFLER